ncbi:MAG: 2-succinyl-5-enolpyruvyl-6-hydroxy-3-cyclohexene-1-carboxylic-acid synthase, partial [Chloroflexi bacterium]|nr:2-succinyl-5-enolpyruvyl-6-hydroxy-3-cyclohexene-1-carboxylic-acid synthase [Chloroflexota bacterium]
LALGLAKAGRRPVAILGTSGTAVVNFGPAVTEAFHGRVPLIVLTADRPPELRDRGAAQPIDQQRLDGSACKWYAELPVPDATDVAVAHLRSVVGRAVAMALEAPAGPVQLNLPFRAPLLPDGPLAPQADDPFSPHTRLMPGVRLPIGPNLDAIWSTLAAARRPLIVVGSFDVDGGAAVIAALAASWDAPVLADALGNLRLGPHDMSHVVARPDSVVRNAAFTSGHAPDVVLRFGGTPTSAATITFLERTAATQFIVDDGAWNDPTLLGGVLIHADPVALAMALAARLVSGGPEPEPGWLDAWLDAGQRADAAIRATLDGFDRPFEGGVFAALEGALPDGAIVVVGSSMPVRDLDAFLTPGTARVRCLANRGVNGIDGVVSTALGVAAADAGPVLLVVGDVSFVHDLNALVAARLQPLSATIVVIDNDGGGIFSFLPQGTVDRAELGLPEHYEQLFGTPHGVDILAVAGTLGAETAELGTADIEPTIAASMARPGVRVLRLRTDRARNVVQHRAVQQAVDEALA